MNKKSMISEQTKNALKNSFLELYAKNGISGVTVSAITKNARYNRCTFYNYYTDVPEMLTEIENTLLSDIKDKAELSITTVHFNNINEVFEHFLFLLEEYGRTICILLSNSGNTEFRYQLKETLCTIYRRAFSDKLDAEQIEWLASYILSSGLGLIAHWYETGKKYSSAEFLKITQPLVMTGVIGYLGEEAVRSIT